MKNKTIAQWLMWSLVAMISFAVLEADDTLVGILALLNWAWIIVAIVRLYKSNEIIK